jgi:ligand-binding SRPBCC domain-containing protein
MELNFEHHVPLPRDTVFGFHENPRHLELILADWKPFRLLHCGDSIATGNEVWVEENMLGILPIVLGYRHVVYEPPRRFGEELIHGPFQRFTHIHEFEDAGKGTTIVRDRLDVAVPWHYGGIIAMRRAVAPRIRHVFGLRGMALQKLAANGTIERLADQRCEESPLSGDH